ncbi:hypothetical protein [Shimia sp. FJ5]|uniref:hypothetical protein n=1 Tax=Shimia sp. FJ5 TaxID=3079054 RepID=UPI00260CA599|nr:hypothetical protein [Shimia sp. FJ5]MDV4144534.1 hypothetical protein [Shimia sp. FJ5]
MARRSEEDIRVEIDQADAVLRIFEEYQRRRYPADFPEHDPNMRLPDKEQWISGLRSQGATWSQILSGYEMAINDHLAAFSMSGPDVAAYSEGLRRFFRERAGEDLFSVVKPPMRKLKAIAKRGRIKDEVDYYLVKECAQSLSGDPRFADLAETLMTCLAEFELAVSETGDGG